MSVTRSGVRGHAQITPWVLSWSAVALEACAEGFDGAGAGCLCRELGLAQFVLALGPILEIVSGNWDVMVRDAVVVSIRQMIFGRRLFMTIDDVTNVRLRSNIV